MFKNLIVYRLGPDWAPSLADVEASLQKARFVPCAASQPLSVGWVPPRGETTDPLAESVGGHWLLRLMVEQKVLPGAVVKRRAEEIAQQIEQTTGRKPGRKQGKEIREQATHELLPMAFTKQASVNVWLAPRERVLVVDSSSAKRAEDVVTLLVKALAGFSVLALQTRLSPAAAMTAWLLSGEPPPQFSIDRDCELKAPDEMKSTVRYVRHGLDIDEVRGHLQAGKQPTRLALTWRGRVSFVLTEALQLKKLGFEDVVFEGPGAAGDRADDGFDTDAAITTGELVQLIPDLIAALDGELDGPG